MRISKKAAILGLVAISFLGTASAAHAADGGGNDVIYGGSGNDAADGGGNDVIYGGSGNEATDGGGNDVIYGGPKGKD